MKGVIIVILSVLFCQLSYAQDKNTIIGDFKSFKRSGQTFNFVLSNSFVQLNVISPNIIQVRADRNKITENQSYAVVGKMQISSIHVAEESTTFKISTDSISIFISKKPFRISYFTIEGKLIQEDDGDFGITWTNNEVTSYKKIVEGERFIGLGEKTGNLDRKGNGYTNWNTDCFGYGTDTDPLYSSIPFFIGIHDNLQYGIFLDNSSRTHFNFGASNNSFYSYSAEVGELDYYFIYHSNVRDVIKSYTYLTGRAPMPAKWSLGYQQCRWSYYPDEEVINIVKTFREKKIPLDVIYLDIHFMENNKVFTWNKDRFPNPKALTDELKSMGIHTAVIVDPGIKVEKEYKTYDSGLENNVFLKYPNGKLYEGSVWPGLCHFPDFSKPETRKWWGDSFTAYTNAGVEGFWNDMNEPATWGQRFPSHVEFNFDGRGGTTQTGRNIYGMQMARSTFEGTKKLLNNSRPFILTRAAFAGSQRYTALWTGDNTATDEHMLLGVRLVNSLGLSGFANVGVDVGGFNGDASAELYTRWMTIGVFTPFFRGHKMINMKESEPWSYGEQTEAIVKNYIGLRYKMLPYLYSLFHEHTVSGIPIARSLAIDYSGEAKVFDSRYQHQFLFGPSILVSPTSSKQFYQPVFFPAGQWYDLNTDSLYEGNKEEIVEAPLHKLPVFVRAGSIIPNQKLTQSTSEYPGDTLLLHVYDGVVINSFSYYEDDGKTYDFVEGNYYLRMITFDGIRKQLSFDIPSGKFQSNYGFIKLILHGFVATELNAEIKSSLKSERYFAVHPESVYRDELYFASKEYSDVQTIVIRNEDKKFDIRLK